MLFMNVMSWEPEKRSELTERYLENGLMIPEEAKLIGAWIGNERIYGLIETDDIQVLQQGHHAWCDLARIDTIPVMELEPKMDLVTGL